MVEQPGLGDPLHAGERAAAPSGRRERWPAGRRQALDLGRVEPDQCVGALADVDQGPCPRRPRPRWRSWRRGGRRRCGAGSCPGRLAKSHRLRDPDVPVSRPRRRRHGDLIQWTGNRRRVPGRPGGPMIVQFNVRDFLDRAEAAYPDRIGLVDEPRPAGRGLGAADLRRPGRPGPGPGRRPRPAGRRARGAGGHRLPQLLPTAHLLLRGVRLGAHPGAGQLPTGPGRGRVHRRALRGVGADGRPGARGRAVGASRREHRFVLGAESDEVLFPAGTRAAGPGRPTRRPPPPSTTPRARRPDRRASSSPTATAGSTPPSSDGTSSCPTGTSTSTPSPCSMPTAGACPGPPRPWAVAQVVLRKVDGSEILRRVDRHGVSLLCAAPAVVNAVLDAAASWDGPIPGAGRTRIVVAGAPPPSRTIERVETELGWEFIQIYGLTETSPLLTVNRHRAEWDEHASRERARKLMRAGAPAVGTAARGGRERRGAGPEQHGDGGVLEPARPRPRRRSGTAGSTPGTAGWSTRRATSASSTARRTSSSPGARTSPPSRWRTPSSRSTVWPRWR